MKTIFKYALVLISPVILFSCQKEAGVSDNSNNGFKTVTLTCCFDNTKVSIDGSGKTAWEAGDQIYVHGEIGKSAGKGQVVTLTAEDIHNDGKTATLTFSEENVPAYSNADLASSYYACYPASAVASAGNMYDYGIYSDTNKPLMQGYDDGEGNMVFYNLGAVISFIVDGDFDSYEFSGNNGETVGYTKVAARLSLKKDNTVVFDIPNDEDLASADKNGDPLTALEGSLVADGTTSNYICIFNGADFKNGFTISFYKDGVIKKTLSTGTAINLARNQYKNLGDVTSNLKDPFIEFEVSYDDSKFDNDKPSSKIYPVNSNIAWTVESSDPTVIVEKIGNDQIKVSMGYSPVLVNARKVTITVSSVDGTIKKEATLRQYSFWAVDTSAGSVTSLDETTSALTISSNGGTSRIKANSTCGLGTLTLNVSNVNIADDGKSFLNIQGEKSNIIFLCNLGYNSQLKTTGSYSDVPSFGYKKGTFSISNEILSGAKQIVLSCLPNAEDSSICDYAVSVDGTEYQRIQIPNIFAYGYLTRFYIGFNSDTPTGSSITFDSIVLEPYAE